MSTTSPNKPSHLYKYQRVTEQTLCNLKARTLWFSAPQRFNDPFDCGLSLKQHQFTDEDFRQSFNQIRGRVPLHQVADFDAKYMEHGLPNERFRIDMAKGCLIGFEQESNRLRNQRGVACLSETNQCLLMWGHYADGHRGFCLEFSTDAEPFSNARQVDYQRELPTLNPVDLLFGEVKNEEIIRALVLTKAACWSYESEWRVIHQELDKKYTYHWKLLTGIYFGSEMSDIHKDIICQLLHGSPTKFYQMKRVDQAFEVSPQHFTYTPYSFQPS